VSPSNSCDEILPPHVMEFRGRAFGRCWALINETGVLRRKDTGKTISLHQVKKQWGSKFCKSGRGPSPGTKVAGTLGFQLPELEKSVV
jgi:hypothetical protein